MMELTNQEIKQLFLDELYNRDVWTKRVPSDPTWNRTRCPYCGDSEHNEYTGHLYIKVNPDDNSKIGYYCFRCDEAGLLTESTLEDLDLRDKDLIEGIKKLNKTGDNPAYSQYVSGTKMRFFDYHVIDDFDPRKVAYLEGRLGISFTKDMLLGCKVITSVSKFLKANHIKEIMWTRDNMQMMEDHYIGFLSYGNSHIIFRAVDDVNSKFRWVKYPIQKESMGNRVMYSLESELDIFTDDTVTVNLTEGILDIISAKYVLNYNSNNSAHISVCGKGYRGVLSYLLEIGFIGSNVKINIFSDNDAMYNKKTNVPTDMTFFRKTLHGIHKYYGSTTIYYNQKGKDIGVPKNEILLEKHRL